MYTEIIQFWFEEIDEASWFTKNDQFDALLKQKFSILHHAAASCELYHWRECAFGSLAEIIILDQFSRNIYRGKPKSFAFDNLALALAQVAIGRELDSKLSPKQRAFMYMPFMHSESSAIHEKAIELYSQPGLEQNLEFEYKHKEIIDKFGRYPHRNEVLGRESTPEEIEFLKQPGSSF